MDQLLYKTYSATGNSFVIFDMREHEEFIPKYSWESLCEKEKVDGLLFLTKPTLSHHDFRMVYLNRDGGEVSMCGNGLRALGVFAHSQGLNLNQHYKVQTKNGSYQTIPSEIPRVLMTECYDENRIKIDDLYPAKKSFYINTGVPHCVYLVEDVESLALESIAKPIRLNERFLEGCNVNFVELKEKNRFKIRTFERGVEGETLSCGTGIIAASLLLKKDNELPFVVESQGGELKVSEGNGGLWLEGEVKETGSGFFNL